MTDVSQAFEELKRGAEEILLEDELLAKLKTGKPLKIKAAGGVRDYETALKMISLGVDRIGTSSSKEIVNKEKNSNSGY